LPALADLKFIFIVLMPSPYLDLVKISMYLIDEQDPRAHL